MASENSKMSFFNDSVKDYTYQEVMLLVDDFKKIPGVHASYDNVSQWLGRWCDRPLEDMPLFINSEMMHERVIAVWRLKIAK